MNAWNSFEGGTTKNWRDLPMSYWGNSPAGGDLVASLDGRCGDWTALLVDTCKVHQVDKNNPVESEAAPNLPVPRPISVTFPCNGFELFRSLGGQNGPTSEFRFAEHSVVKYRHGTYYYIMDPSYGKIISGTSWVNVETDWECLSIENYTWPGPPVLFWIPYQTERNEPFNKGVRFTP